MATEIRFYHLTSTPFEKGLPLLLEKVLNSGSRAIIIAKNDSEVQRINKFLWTFSTKRVVPHGSEEDGFPEEQPAYLTTKEENPNNADTLVTTGGTTPAFVKDFSRCIDIFDGNNDNELKEARERWKKYKQDTDTTLVYWKQGEKGNWEQAG